MPVLPLAAAAILAAPLRPDLVPTSVPSFLSQPALAAQEGDRPADASEAPDGLWWGAGVGVGSLRFTCDLCEPGRDGGPSIFGQVGAWADPAVRVALEVGGWTREDDDLRETLYRAGLTGFFHPDPDRGLYLLAGLAWVGYRADEARYDSGALSVGLGWDLPLFPEWTVGNAARIDAASFGSFHIEDERVAGDVGLSMIRFEVTLRRR